jgi:hypothetical protein
VVCNTSNHILCFGQVRQFSRSLRISSILNPIDYMDLRRAKYHGLLGLFLPIQYRILSRVVLGMGSWYPQVFLKTDLRDVL